MAFLLGDDDEHALEAALSFVEEFKLDDERSSSHVQAGGVHSSRKPAGAEDSLTKRARANARKKLLRQAGIYSDPNRARNERTREIAVLREQIEKLQIDLHTLQSRQPQQGRDGSRPLRDGVLIPKSCKSQISSMWQDQALRQQRRREEAERDNVRLRLAVGRQRKVANSLQTLMKKRANQLTNECASLMDLCCSRHNTVDVLDFCGDIEDFRELFQRVDDAYRDVDTVFAANGLARSTISPGDVHMREGVDGKYLEFSTYKDMPYELRAATEAVWDHFKGVEKHLGVGSIYAKAAKNMDEPYTIVEDFSIEIYSNSSRADYKTKQVVRRYVEAERDIVIWVSHATPVEVKHKLLSGLAYNFLGYAITKRSSASTAEQELTQLQLCSRMSLDQEADTIYSSDSARTLANFLIVHAAKNIVAHRDSIENSLADRVLRFGTLNTLDYRGNMRSPRDDELSDVTLSLVDEFLLDEAVDGALLTLQDADMAATMQIQSSDKLHPDQNESQRRSEYNARRRLLRKAGVYGDPNRARNARKKEIADLRERAEKLQIDLEVWQGHKSHERATPSRTSGTSMALLPNKWQEIALNQRRRRKGSERDNARLKLAVAHQQELAKHLYGLLRKRSTQLRNECSSLVNATSAKHYVVDVLDYNKGVADFQLLLQELDAAYREIDAVFMANGLSSSAISPIAVHVRDGVDGKQLELCSYKVLPFDVSSTTDAAWTHYKGMEKHLGNGAVYKKAEKDLDEPYTIVADFTKELYAGSSRADIQVKQIVRRYVENDRDIVIWVSRARPAEIKHKMLRGLTYRLRGYAVTKRFSGSTPDRELSEFQQCSLLALDQDVKTKYSCEDVDAITNFLLVNAAQNIRVHRELIENALVDKARTHCPRLQ